MFGKPEVRQWSTRGNNRQYPGSGLILDSNKMLNTSDRFANPLAAESEGGVFPPEVSMAER